MEWARTHHYDGRHISDLQRNSSARDNRFESKVASKDHETCKLVHQYLCHLLTEREEHTDDQIDNQNGDHAPQWDMEPVADMGKILGVRERLVTSHTPGQARASVVRADDDEEVQANHYEGAEEAAAVDAVANVHPPIHVGLRCCREQH